MKTEKLNYETPKVKVVCVQVEKGFAISNESLPTWGNGGSLQDAQQKTSAF